MKNHLTKAPFATGKTGNLYLVDKVHGFEAEVSFTHYHGAITWLPNVEFYAVMEYVAGRAFVVRDMATDIEYPVFPSEVSKHIEFDAIAGRQVVGMWQIVKRNVAYGIQLVSI